MTERIAQLITGKDKPTYDPKTTPVDGDTVIVVNVNKTLIKGRKA